MKKIIIDQQIYLEQIEFSHAQRAFELTQKNRELLREWLLWVDGVKSVENTKKFIEKTISNYEKNRTPNMSIFYEDRIVGNIELGIKHGYGTLKGELGYWLDQDFHGKGIIHKSAKKMVEMGFRELNLDKIDIRCAVQNNRSCNVAQKLGFRHEGILRGEVKVNGVVMDVNLYAILRSDFEEIS